MTKHSHMMKFKSEKYNKLFVLIKHIVLISTSESNTMRLLVKNEKNKLQDTA